MELLGDMDPLLKVFWYLAIPISFIFVVQTIMTFVGAGDSDGLNADFDGNLDHEGAPFQLFSFRNLINFLLGFSWTGISFFQLIPNTPLLIILSVTVGVLFILVFFAIIRQIQKLAEDNTFRIETVLNRSASVYLRIPENRTGTGKIHVSANGSFKEIDAITNQDEISSGSVVKIIKIESNNLVLVEKI
jgi:membrane protein implicated in regulation of membrane protease activity